MLCEEFIWMGNVTKVAKFNEGFIKNYNGDDDEGYFLEVDVPYPEKVHEKSTMIYSFYLKEWKLKE